MTQREHTPLRRQFSNQAKQQTATVLSLISAAFLLLGMLTGALAALGYVWLEGTGNVSSWALMFGLLVASMLVGWLVFYMLRGIALLRGTARWYWAEKTPPFEEGVEENPLDEYLSVSAGNYEENADVDRMRDEFLSNLVYGLSAYLAGMLISFGIVSFQSDIRPLVGDGSSIDVLVRSISFLFQVPLGLIELLNLPIPSGPLNAAVFVFTVGVPALFFTVAFANLSELLERRYFATYTRVLDRDLDDVNAVSWILVVAAVLGMALPPFLIVVAI